MARHWFGGTTNDMVVRKWNFGQGNNLLALAAGQEVTVWDSETGGTRLLDLLVNGVPAIILTADEEGYLPRFQGPDGVQTVWLDTGDGMPRRLSVTTDAAIDLSSQLATKINTSEKGAADGVATLGADSKIPTGQIPDLSATYATKAVNADERLRYVNVFDDFMGGASNVWVDGQGITATTTTSEVASGGTVIPVADGTGLLNGVSLILKEGTVDQQVVRITAGGGTTSLTVTPALSSTLASGSAVTPFWEDSLHLTGAGYTALAYYVAQAKDVQGNFLITGTNPKITLIGNSWFARSNAAPAWSAQILARIPGATVTNVALGGSTSQTNLDRWSNVPADSDYVLINEPGVNDDDKAVAMDVQLANLAEMVRRIRGIGAIPVLVGHVPIVTQTFVAENNRKTVAAIGDGYAFPGHDAARLALLLSKPNTTSIGIGESALRRVTTGVNNTACGYGAQNWVTSGASNTAVGAYAQLVATTGVGNTAVGSQVQSKLTTGGDNTAVGKDAHLDLTTGVGNVAIGAQAQQALATGSDNVAVGRLAQLSLTSGTGLNVAIGSAAQRNATTAHNNVAVGGFTQWSLTTGNQNACVGSDAQRSITTGQQNTALGYSAGYLANGNTANATTTAVGQTLVGAQTGQGSATASNYITTLGFKATADGHGAVAIGTDSGGAGAVASGANSFVLGTANHRYKMPGLPTVNPGAGSGILWNDAGTVKVA